MSSSSSSLPILLGLAVLAALTVACVLLGGALRRLVGGAPTARSGATSRLHTLGLDLAAGLLVLHLSLLALQALGFRWSLLAVTAALGLAGLALALLLRFGPGTPIQRAEEGQGEVTSGRSWSDAVVNGVVLLAVLGFAFATWTLRATHPDFVFHWGIKAKRFLLAGGLDLSYLSRSWNHFIHPDYPRLISELYTVTALPMGRLDEPVLLLWSVVFFAALLVSLKEALRRAAVEPVVSRVMLVSVALALAAFAVGQRLAGGADLPLAFALAAALPVLLGPCSRPGDDWALGIAAAFAAASKIEGVVLAVALCVAHLVRLRREERLAPAAAARSVLPALLVIGPWLGINWAHGLFQATNSGPLEPGRWPVVLEALGSALTVRSWHGLSVLVLATPLLLVPRRTRALAAVVLVQLGFYLWVYFTMAGDVGLLVRLSFPRLLLPLLPAVVVASAVALSGSSPGPER